MKKAIFLFGIIVIVSAVHGQSKDEEAITKVLNTYKSTLEKLDTSGITSLFAPDAKVLEQGNDEGGIENYLNHHLGPELKAFKAFQFSDYKLNIKVLNDYAYTIETYKYTIVLAKDDSQIKSEGVATSILRKYKDGWKVELTHSSFRRAR